MRSIARLSILLALLCVAPTENRAAEESLGDKIKKIFEPTPTPTPHKHRKTTTSTKKKKTSPSPSPAKKKKPSPTPTPSPKPKAKASPSATVKPTPEASPSESPVETEEASPSPAPKKHKKISPTPTPETSPTPSARKHHKVSPTPTPSEEQTPPSAPSPSSSATVQPGATPAPSPAVKKKGAPVSISSSEIVGYENYPEPIRKVLDLALDLAGRGLEYKYGSADPANGGMDCSGFVFYVLTQIGVPDVPRDSSQQYVWLRKSYKFQPVLSRHEDSFELDALTPGDLLFWTGTYAIDRDPPITHAMIYLGREKHGGQRIMVGASDGRIYKGESRYGVSIFDFKIPQLAKTNDGKLTPVFIGYGHVPGLRGQ